MDEIDISALAANAAAAYGEERVRTDDRVVRIDFDEATLTFCVRGDGESSALCRSLVTPLTRMDDPAAFCQQALEANCFWQGTGGGWFSVDADATAMYLTDRVLAGEISDPDRLSAYVQRFVGTLADWRLRARSAQGGVGGLPQSADFSLPESEQAPSDAKPDPYGGLVIIEA